jgi:hypothetical protein
MRRTVVKQFLSPFGHNGTLPVQLQRLSTHMSTSDRTRPPLSTTPRPETTATNAPVPPNGSDPYANWLDRMQRARARHAAITKNLHTWSNYKNWTDQVKESWVDESAEKKNEK